MSLIRHAAGALVATALLLATPAGAAPTGVWTAIGPYGGAVVQQLAADPSNPGTVYAATRAGVWKSTDGAQHWSWSSQGLANMYVTSIAVDPVRPSRVFAGTLRLPYESQDAGATWSPVHVNPLGWDEFDIATIAIAPSRPDTMYVGGPDGIFGSTDGGVHWGRLHDGQAGVVTVDPHNAGVVYVSMPTQLLKTVDGGAHWAALPTDHPWLGSLVIDPAHPDTLYAADGQVRKSVNGGATWSLLDTPAASALFNLTVPRARPATIYGGGWSGNLSYLARSDDGGASWTPLGALPVGAATGPVLAVDASLPDVVYAGTFYHGIYKSTNAGASFTEANDGLAAEPAWAIAFDPHDARTVYASIGGLYRSVDDGAHWMRIDAGLQVPNRDLSVHALSTDGAGTLYAARNFDADALVSPVMKSTDHGDHWSDAGQGLPVGGDFAKSVYADPTTPGTVFAAVNHPGPLVDDSTGGLYKTTDGGESWTMVAPTAKPVQALAFDVSTHTIALASGTLGEAGVVQLYESSDWGSTWRPLPGPRFRTSSLAFGPTPATVYAGGNLAAVAKSTDGGSTWAQHLLDPVTYNGPGGINAVAVDPTDPSLVYAATESAGIWSSRDGGVTWQPLVPGLEDVRAMTVAFPSVAPSGSRLVSGVRPPIVPVFGGSVGYGIQRFYPAPHAMRAPFVVGRGRVGRVLACWTGSWSRAVSFRFSWSRGKVALVRYKTARYKIKRRDRGSSLRCRVSAVGPGGTIRAFSRAVRVRR